MMNQVRTKQTTVIRTRAKVRIKTKIAKAIAQIAVMKVIRIAQTRTVAINSESYKRQQVDASVAFFIYSKGLLKKIDSKHWER